MAEDCVTEVVDGFADKIAVPVVIVIVLRIVDGQMVLNYHEDLAKGLAKEQSSGSDKNSDYQRLQEDMVRYHERMNAMLHDVAYPLYMTAEAAKTLKGNDPFEAVREKAERILKQLEQERGASSPNG